MNQNFSLSGLLPGFYVPGNSFLHRIPVARKLFLALIVLGIAASAEWNGIAGAGILCLIGLFISRMGCRAIFSRLKYFVWFIFLLAIFPLFFTTGTSAEGMESFSWGMTPEGLEAAGLTACRLILMFLVSMMFIHTTSPSEMFHQPIRKDIQGNGIGSLLNEAGKVGLMAFQVLPVLCIEVEQWVSAELKARKEEIRGSLFNKARQVARLLVPLTVSIFENPERFSERLKNGDSGFQTGECKLEENFIH